MRVTDSFIAITRRVIARDGFDEYLPTLMLPATQDVLVLEGAPLDSMVAAIARQWAEERAEGSADYLLAYKVDERRFAVVARLAGVVHESEEWIEE